MMHERVTAVVYPKGANSNDIPEKPAATMLVAFDGIVGGGDPDEFEVPNPGGFSGIDLKQASLDRAEPLEHATKVRARNQQFGRWV